MNKISLIIPYRSDHAHRADVWSWLHDYWATELPDAEILLGVDHASDDSVFSKTCAVNEAFARSTGDVIVLLDADAYLPGSVITHCAARIRNARQHGARTWFIPYQSMYRLTDDDTARLLKLNPQLPYNPNKEDTHDDDGYGPGLAKRYGAIIQIMPREAFETVGGMDERFRGWGGEDISFLRALDTLWGKHKNTANDVYHLWHPRFATESNNPYIRVWNHQPIRGRANDWLALKYGQAVGQPAKMRHLVNEARQLADT